MTESQNPAAAADAAAAPKDDESENKLGASEIVMRKMAADPAMRSSGMSIWMLDQAPDWDRLVESWDRASRLVPRMRQRLVDPAMGIGAPTWVTDPNFDLHYHVRRVRVPEPGTLRQLLDLARPVAMAPADAARPPWEVVVVEGLEGGRAAVLQKGEHTMTDGQGGMQMMQIICDFERDAPKEPVPLPPAPEPGDPSPTALARAEVSDRLRAGPRSGRARAESISKVAASVIRHPRKSASSTATMAASVGRMFGAMRIPKSPLFEGRSLSHSYDILEVDLGDLRKAGKSVGGSLNDAFLAGLLGGVRIYHERHGMPIETLSMGFAISTRKPEDPLTSNKFSDVVIGAPVGISDPQERIEKIRELVLGIRGEPALEAMESVLPLMSQLPTAILAAAFSGAGGDVNASNLAGPPIQLYMAGAEVQRLYGFGPLVGCAMMAGLISVMGTCCIGVNMDPAAIPNPDEMVDCLKLGFEEVLNLGGEHGGVGLPARGEAKAAAKPKPKPKPSTAAAKP